MEDAALERQRVQHHRSTAMPLRVDVNLYVGAVPSQHSAQKANQAQESEFLAGEVPIPFQKASAII
eukprot:337641-Pleurochrysis_carterae.AAC.3